MNESPITNESEVSPKAAPATGRPSPAFLLRRLGLFCAIALVWLAIDRATKIYCNGFELGSQIAGPFLGLFDFTLVHNTGAAWGMFGNVTFVLGIVSLVICAFLLIYAFAIEPEMPLTRLCVLSLVFAGGIGNAIDRFTQGYVVDFINFTFVDFPVFNIADIGVTCGIVLFFLLYLLEWRKSS